MDYMIAWLFVSEEVVSCDVNFLHNGIFWCWTCEVDFCPMELQPQTYDFLDINLPIAIYLSYLITTKMSMSISYRNQILIQPFDEREWQEKLVLK